MIFPMAATCGLAVATIYYNEGIRVRRNGAGIMPVASICVNSRSIGDSNPGEARLHSEAAPLGDGIVNNARLNE
jgi:hypothetical protein